MPYSHCINIILGRKKSGITDLVAQLIDTNSNNVGSPINTGFSEIGNGFYLWHYNSFPDNHRGGVKFYSASASSIILATTDINPEEVEFTDVKTSSRGTGAALDAAGIRSAVGLASANLDTQLSDIPTIKSKTDQMSFAGGNILADIRAIWAHTPSASAFRTMLDGTGGNRLHLRQLVVAASGNDSAFDLSGSGTGSGIIARGGINGHGIRALGGGTSGAGLSCVGQGSTGRGIEGIGGSDATGIYGQGSGTGSGIMGGALGVGFGLYALGGITGGAGAVFQARASGDVNSHGIRAISVAAKSIGATNNILGDLEGTAQLDMTQSVPVSPTPQTVGDALNSAINKANLILSTISASVWAWPTRSLTDKTGFYLHPSEHELIYSYVPSGLTAQGYTTVRAPKLDNLDVAVSTRSTITISGVWDHSNRTLTALGSGLVDEIWNRLRSAVSRPAGSFGEYLDMKISDVSVGGGGSDWTTDEKSQIRKALGISGTKMNTDGLGVLDTVSASVWAWPTRTLSSLGASLVDEIWNRLRSAVSRPSGSFGDYLDARITEISAGGGGDWTADERSQIRKALGISGTKTNTDGLGVLDTVSASVWAWPTRTLTDKSGFSLSPSEHSTIITDVTSGLTAQGYTPTRAGFLDVLSGIVASIWSYATRTLTAFGFNVNLNLSQIVGASQPAGSVGRALQIARAQGRGAWVIDNTSNTLTLYDTDNTTVVAVFSLTPPGGPYSSRTASSE